MLTIMFFAQDMACDTFLKIVQKCKRKFVIVQVRGFDIFSAIRLFCMVEWFDRHDVAFQVGENEPFVSELLTGLATTIADLEPHQIHSFYESVSITSLYVN